MSVSVPHFALPFRVGPGGGFAVLEQDTLDEVAQCVTVLVSTPVGSRDVLPEYGIDEPTFARDIDVDGIRRAVDEWEPRAAVMATEEPDRFDDLVRRVRVAVEVES